MPNAIKPVSKERGFVVAPHFAAVYGERWAASRQAKQKHEGKG